MSRVTSLVAFVTLVILMAARMPAQSPAQRRWTRAESEAFLNTATIVPAAPGDERKSWRATLESGGRTHDASIETADGSDPTRRNYRFNVAAYELDKLLGLGLVPPVVERLVTGRPASLTWWVDDFAMAEVDRRRKKIDPPDGDAWNKQMQAVRVFDELISNTYRDTSPGLYLNSVWDNLLITSGWTVWIVDHTASFRTRRELQDTESLTRCPRAMLDKLRGLNRAVSQKNLGRYLSVEQLAALEARRILLVRHFEEEIARNGEAAVLYGLPPRGF
jgi:hypothetical protein